MALHKPTKTQEKEAQEARFDQLYGRLNPAQRLAVDTIEGPVMVMAGPGTGKTQVLAMRIAAILRTTQMDPWNILCLTFTESGVVAMRERLLSMIGSPAYQVRIHTFHSFCNEIIQENPELFAWTRGVQVISDIDRVLLFRSIIETLSVRSPLKPFGDPYLYFRDIAANIQDLKREDISPVQFGETVSRLEKFSEAVHEEVHAFFTLKPTERDTKACEDIYEVLAKAAQQYDLPASMIGLLDHMVAQYREQEGQADGKREASKMRTAYKNAVKKWVDKMVDSLPKQQEMALVYATYQERLTSEGKYDYEDMIMRVVEALKSNDALLARYQEQFQYMLVDEYQDTNGAQNDIVDIIGSFGPQPNVFVVGDDKQSIYRFQGASLANMLHFYERYKDSIAVISLKENYRSGQTILDAASGIIIHNQESVAAYIPGVTQQLTAVSGRTAEPVTLHLFRSEDAEDYFVAMRAKALIESGVPPHEIAVLYRYNRDGQSLFSLMQRLSIPVRLEIGENVLEDHLVRQWISLLMWLTDGNEEGALTHILQYDWWHLPPVDVLKVIHYAGLNHTDLYGVLTRVHELKAAGVEKPQLFLDFANRLALWRKDATDLPLQHFLEKLVVESHWLDHVMEHEKEAAALRKVTTLLNEAKNLQAAHREFRLEDFVQHLSLLHEHGVPLALEPWQSKQEAVRLMSAHKAKGLEFDHVFVMRMNDKHWGNERQPNHIPLPPGLVKYDYSIADANEDARRLLYVAITRAKQHVYVTRATYSASGRETAPSLFWGEFLPETVALHDGQESDEDVLVRLSQSLLSPVQYAGHHDVREYIRSLLSTYVMSITHLNNYLDCPRKFYFRNLLRIPTVKTKHLAMGSAVHAALYDLFVALSKTGKALSKDAVLKSFDRAMRAEFLPAAEFADAKEQGRHMLAAYYDHYRGSFSHDVLLEYSFAGHGVHIGDLPLTGAIDKVEIVDSKAKEVNVVDYKTGNVESGLKKLAPGGDYHRQLVFYKLLCDESPRFDYTMVSGEIDFIEPSVKKGFIKKKIQVTEADVAELKETIGRVWKEIQELKFLDSTAGCTKEDCEYCA